MDILTFVRDELQYLPYQIDVKFVQVPQLIFPQGKNTFQKCQYSQRYWLPWTKKLAAWVSADGLQVEIVATEDVQNSRILGTLTLGLTSVIAATCLNLQKRVAIHANSVSFDNLAVAFVGESGVGKSTLSTYCASRGAGFVTDDVLVVNTEGMVHLGNPRIKLFPHTAASLGLDASQETEYKIFYHPHDLGAKLHQQPVPLGIIYLPAISKENRIYSQQIAPMQAISLLLAEGYHASKLITEYPSIFSAYVNLVKSIPVKRLFYPRDFSLLPEVHKFIRREASSLPNTYGQITTKAT